MMDPLRKLRATPAVVVNRVRAIRNHAFLPRAQNDSGDSCRSSLRPFVRRRQRDDFAAAAAPLNRLVAAMLTRLAFARDHSSVIQACPLVGRRQRDDLAAAAAPLCRLATTTRIRPATAAGPQEAA